MNAKTSTKSTQDENSYRSILKGTSIFGGVQLFHVLVSIIRGKLVAMLLGPAGMGVSALYVSSTATVQRFASLGLNLALVKETGEARSDEARLRHVVGVARRLTLVTALLGALACMGLSRWLSVASFGDTSHTLAFIGLGLMVFFSIASGGESSLLQGVHDVRRLSKATLFGSAAGLLISVPLYWLYGIDGIVPAMIMLALAVYLFYLFSARKAVGGNGGLILRRSDWPLVCRLLGLGVMLMASDLAGSLAVYALQAYVRLTGNLDDVGFFQGANSVTMQYSGLVFAALSMEYFPRLSSVVADDRRMQEVIARQMEVVSCLIAPLAGMMILAAPLVVEVLLTREFLHVVPLLRWLAYALLFQALMFPMAYVTFAKNNKKVYFWMEVVGGNVMILLCSALGYRLFGLVGLGYGSLVDKVFWLAVTYIVNRRLYGVRLGRNARLRMQEAVVGGTAVMMLSFLPASWWSVTLMAAAVAAMTLLALMRLRAWFMSEREEDPDTPPPGKVGKVLRMLDMGILRISSIAAKVRERVRLHIADIAGLIRQSYDGLWLCRGKLRNGTTDAGFADKYYPMQGAPQDPELTRGIVVRCDGRIFHGGLTDRLRGILTLYSEARRRGMPFHIYWTSPFPLTDYLVPASVDWRITAEELIDTRPGAFPVIVDDLTPAESRVRVRAALRHHCTQHHFYTNADYARGDYSVLFTELFRPSPQVEKELAHHLDLLGEEYYAFTTRFLSLLGDFKEWDTTTLPHAESEALMEKVAREFDRIAASLPADCRILLTSDSRRFLDYMAGRDTRIYIVPGEVRNIDLGTAPAPDAWLKTFTDQQLLMRARHVWLLRTDRMYPSGFPRFAAEVGSRPFTRHDF